ncbi:MAG: EAL domain-containing protein [Treponema sp.]
MDYKFSEEDISEIKKNINLLNDLADTNVFVLNITKDQLLISKQLSAQFNLLDSPVENALSKIKNLIIPEDREHFEEECVKLAKCEKEEHSIEYRVFNKKQDVELLSSHGKIITDADTNEKLLVGRLEFIGNSILNDNLTDLISDVQLENDFLNIQTKDKTVSGFFLKIDIDNLGAVNEQYGNAYGDKEIKMLAECCKRVADESLKVYRSHSDEIIFMNLTGKNAIDAQRLFASIKREISVEEERTNYEMMFTVSGGTIAFFDDSSSFSDLIRKLDFTLSEAKRLGKNKNALYAATAFNKHLRELEIKRLLRESVKNNFEGFCMNFQPIVNAQTKALIGCEALLRWTSNEFGAIKPDEFIPLLEETGLVIPVGRWVLLTSFRQAELWAREKPDFQMSVNLSYIQIKKSDILTDVQNAITQSFVKPKNIVLEITESGYLGGQNDSILQITEQFSKMGIRIDIDDFGTGYSNLRYLQYLHAETLKLDYTFTNKAVHNEYDRNVIKHIAAMAHSVNMKVCMEGVEYKSEEEILSKLGADKFQGYLYGRPTTAEKFYDEHLHEFVKNAYN